MRRAKGKPPERYEAPSNAMGISGQRLLVLLLYASSYAASPSRQSCIHLRLTLRFEGSLA
jgi:hypothetical protein